MVTFSPGARAVHPGKRLAGVNALSSPALCPQSRQPELKHAAVKVLKAELPWSLWAMAWLPDEQVQASLAPLPRRPPRLPDPLATLAVPPGASPGAGARFFVLRPHAEGGLGRVLVARDEELQLAVLIDRT